MGEARLTAARGFEKARARLDHEVLASVWSKTVVWFRVETCGRVSSSASTTGDGAGSARQREAKRP